MCFIVSVCRKENKPGSRSLVLGSNVGSIPIDIGWDQGSLVNGKLPHSWSRQKLPSMKTHPKIKHDAPSAETILFILTQVFLSYGQCIQSLPMVMPNSEW